MANPEKGDADMGKEKESLAVAIAKLFALSGGAIAGAFLTGWIENLLAERAQRRSEYDRSRYAQGLTPVAPQGAPTDRRADNQSNVIRIEDTPQERQTGENPTA